MSLTVKKSPPTQPRALSRAPVYVVPLQAVSNFLICEADKNLPKPRGFGYKSTFFSEKIKIWGKVTQLTLVEVKYTASNPAQPASEEEPLSYSSERNGDKTAPTQIVTIPIIPKAATDG